MFPARISLYTSAFYVNIHLLIYAFMFVCCVCVYIYKLSTCIKVCPPLLPIPAPPPHLRILDKHPPHPPKLSQYSLLLCEAVWKKRQDEATEYKRWLSPGGENMNICISVLFYAEFPALNIYYLKKQCSWSVVNLQWCVNYCCTAKWFSCTYTFFSIMACHGILITVPCTEHVLPLITGPAGRLSP